MKNDCELDILTDFLKDEILEPPSLVNAYVNDDYRVEIDWSNTEGALGYYVFKSTDEDGEYEKIGTTTTNIYLDCNTLPNTTYFYRIAAFTNCICSLQSDSVAVTIPDITKNPPPPENVAVVLQWQNACCNCYTVWRATDTGAKERIAQVNRAMFIDKVPSCHTYNYTITLDSDNTVTIAEFTIRT